MAKTTIREDGEHRGWLLQTGRSLRPWINRRIARSSILSNDPVIDAASFAWTGMLEKNWETIRSEAMAVLAEQRRIPLLREISADHRNIADDKWRSFFLWGYGYRVAQNCARCPKTTALVSAIPNLNSAFFSILKSGAHIPRHKGVTKHLLTCHLGLLVPKDEKNCRMKVSTVTVNWREGKCLVFDDTYRHEIWNDTEQDRIILLIQVKRPSRLPGRWIGDLFLAAVRQSRFVQEARRNIGTWSEALETTERI
jgi:beta-hydroxylase